MIAQREIFWNLPSPLNPVLMYVVFAAALAICTAGLLRRFLLWTEGRADPERLGDWGRRFSVACTQIFGQSRVSSEAKPGFFHALIYTGFLVLLFTTTMVFIDYDLGIRIYHGDFYLAVTVLSDLFGLLFLMGLMIAVHRRYIERPDRLHSGSADLFLLGALALLIVQGYLLEGLRIHVTADPWRYYSPVGWVVSKLFYGMSERAARLIHFITWWFHTVTVFAAIALLPYTKFLHLIASSANLFFRELRRPRGALRYPGDIEAIMEDAVLNDKEFSIGARTLEDLTWKQRLDLDACTSCGRCQAVCPAYNSGKMLSPKWLILDTRDHMLTRHAEKSGGGFFARLDRLLLKRFLLKRVSAKDRAANELVQRSAPGVGTGSVLGGEVLEPDVFWSCTTCQACVEVCPVGIEHVDYILEVRRSLALMDGAIPAEAQSSLRAIETRGNPFGPAAARLEWAEGLEVPRLEAGGEIDVLYWVGCVSAYDKRKQKIARSVVKILQSAGIKFAILSNETCTGDPARRLGEENLYQSQAKKNNELLASVKVKTIVANCPHCFNTLRNEYPQLGSGKVDSRVIHHTQLIEELLREGKLALKQGALEEITYHDPCYLGRYNGHYDEPRDVLIQLGSVREMKDSREGGKCCGAGGGHFWMDMKVGERVNVQRVDQAAETGAKVVATACPFCLQMMEDGVKLTNREESLQVRDIAELVADALQ